MREYEIKFEPIDLNGLIINKWNIYYYINGEFETKEFYKDDYRILSIREGYLKKETSLFFKIFG